MFTSPSHLSLRLLDRYSSWKLLAKRIIATKRKHMPMNLDLNFLGGARRYEELP